MSARLVSVLLFSVFVFSLSCTARALPTATRRQEQRPRSFLLAKDIHQWLDFDYQYDYSASDSGGDDASSSHSLFLQNSYHFDTLYAVLRPKLLMGRLAMDVGFDGEWQKNQQQGDDYGVTPAVEYRLDGTFFKDEVYPVQFNSFYSKDMIDRVFASNYDMDIRGERLGFSYKNLYLPTQLTVSQSESKSSGLTNDRTTNFRNILMNSSHRYKDFSYTSVNMMYGQLESQSENESGLDMSTDTVSLMGDNQLDFSKKSLLRYFKSQYSYTDSQSDEQGGAGRQDWNKNTIWTERLYWQLGRALFSGLDYRNTFFESPLNEQKVQAGNGWLQHRLFDNFKTMLRMGSRENILSQGTEGGWNGSLDFDYTRHLPQESNLTIGLGNSYAVTERDLESSVMPVVDVPFLYNPAKFNYLKDYDIQLDTIVVRNKERTLIYDEGIDYIVESIGRQTRITIPDGSAINPGDLLSIDYYYLTNPDIKYATKTNSVYSAVDLFQNSYRIMGQVTQGRDTLLEGDDSNVGLMDFRQYQIEIDRNFRFWTLSCLYGDMDGNMEKYHYWEPSVEYTRYFQSSYLSFSASLSGRQTEYENVVYRDIASGEGSERSLMAQASVRRPVRSLAGALWETRADYLQMDGRGNDNKEVTVNSALQISLGKSRIRLEGEVAWMDDNGRQSQNALVRLQFRRFF
jgi:hypothetical protein